MHYYIILFLFYKKIIMSRIEFSYEYYNIKKELKKRWSLNYKKLKYITNEKKNGRPSAELAAIYRASTMYINKIYYNHTNYRNHEKPYLPQLYDEVAVVNWLYLLFCYKNGLLVRIPFRIPQGLLNSYPWDVR